MILVFSKKGLLQIFPVARNSVEFFKDVNSHHSQRLKISQQPPSSESLYNDPFVLRGFEDRAALSLPAMRVSSGA